jgi:pyruvate formate lyase activating enzyme
MKLSYFNIQRFCLHDGDGIRTTVFLKGCPLRCVWCHNPESQKAEKELMFLSEKCVGCKQCLGLCDAREVDGGKISVSRGRCKACGECAEVCLFDANEICGTEDEAQTIMAEVLRDKIFFAGGGGLTVSGGEPAFQPEGVLELCEIANREGISTVIETSGFGDTEFFLKAASLGAEFYYDIKALDDEKHRRLTGGSNGLILKNLSALIKQKARIVLRLPLVPGLNDSDSDLSVLAEFLKEHEGVCRRAEIMKYHVLGSGKAQALSCVYKAPPRDATEEEALRWLSFLRSAGVDNISLA